MKTIYSLDVDQISRQSGIPIAVVETETDLYYHMALSMYREIEKNNNAGRTTAMILPVGPVFQYRRFLTLLDFHPLDLSKLHIFFMDEYLKNGTSETIETESPLSFRGFTDRELCLPLEGRFGFNSAQIHFPNPAKPESYDADIAALGGIDLCHAGVGIVGHLAFNEPLPSAEISAADFCRLPTRIVELTRETITINSNTALRGAFDEVPKRAVTIGMGAILSARRLEIYMNRPWQAAVLRKALLLEPSPEFPVTCARNHPALSFTVTPVVADIPNPALK